MDDLDRDLELQDSLDDDSDLSDSSYKKRQKPKLPLVKPLHVDTRKETGFLRTSRMCLERIREAMLHHRWQEAAEYMACYPQVLESKISHTWLQYKELVWRISTEILHHHPNSTMEDYNRIYEQMKHSGFKRYLMISLEHCFHLMLHGQIEQAKQQLSVAESWRHGKELTSERQCKKLIQAYRSLLDYIIWCDKKSSKNSSFDSDNQGMHNYFRQASVNLKDIVKNPGIWDPFILCYVEMLEYYEDHEEAFKILNDYARDKSFPPNPNAHVYVYEYLKRHDAPEKKLMKVLKNLHNLVPSHELMLEFSFLLLQSEKKSNTLKALGVVLDMLDFACWRSDLNVWKCLQAVIQKLKLQDNWQMIVREEMVSRKDWWPLLHFTSFHAKKDSKENPKLLKVKAPLLKILCPDGTLRYGDVDLSPSH